MTNQEVLDNAVVVVMPLLGYESNTGTTEGIFLWENDLEDGTAEFLNSSEAEQKCLDLNVLAEVLSYYEFAEMLLYPAAKRVEVFLTSGQPRRIIQDESIKSIQEAALVATALALSQAEGAAPVVKKEE